MDGLQKLKLEMFKNLIVSVKKEPYLSSILVLNFFGWSISQ